jgi:hypothetical protein
MEAELIARRVGDFDAQLGELARLVGAEREAQRLGLDDGEGVAAVGGIHLKRAEPRDLERGVEPVDEGRQVLHRDALGLAVAAGRRHLHQPARRLEHEAGFGLVHFEDAGFQ